MRSIRDGKPGYLLLALVLTAGVVAIPIVGTALHNRAERAATHRRAAVAIPKGHPDRVLRRSHLDGLWRANGYVLDARGGLYPQGMNIGARRWAFYRVCRHQQCALWMARESTSGILRARVSGHHGVWRASFPRYGEVICGSAAHRVRAALESHWVFRLNPRMSNLRAMEWVRTPKVCGHAWAEIEWNAMPTRIPPRQLPLPRGAVLV